MVSTSQLTRPTRLGLAHKSKANVENLEANDMIRPGKLEANRASPDERPDEARSGDLLS